MAEFFTEVTERIPYEGPDSDNPLAFHWYDADRVVAGRRMEDHLRFAVCYWHSFNWDGFDIFGAGTLDRPWHPTFAPAADPMRRGEPEDGRRVRVLRQARRAVLLLPRSRHRARGRLVQGVGGTARRDGRRGGRRTSSAPACSCCGAPPTCSPTRATRPARRRTPIRRCSPTPPRRSPTASRPPTASAARTTCCGADARATTRCSTPTCAASSTSSPASCRWSSSTSTASGSPARSSSSPSRSSRPSTSTTTTSPPCTRSCSATTSRTRSRSTSRSTTPRSSGHDFAHEIAVAVNAGIFGSIDANAGDDRLGWDVDRFPVSVEQMALGMLEILRAGGFTTGGLNFDAKLRRQSIDRTDLFHGHIGGMDTMARALLVADADPRRARRQPRRPLRRLGRRAGPVDPRRAPRRWPTLHDRAFDRGEPARVSGGQERLENLVARHVATVR